MRRERRKAEKGDLLRYGGWGKESWAYSKKETLWYLLLFITPFFSLKIYLTSARLISDIERGLPFSYPDGYILVAVINILCCLSIPFLLKDSETNFRSTAILLTSIIPGLLTLFGWYSLVTAASQ